MGLFDRFASTINATHEIDDSGANPFTIAWDDVLSQTEAVWKGRKTVLAGTHNYLGLTFSEDCIEAGVAALRQRGTGTTGSRIANGTYPDHFALEAQLAEFFGKRVCMAFTTGFQANLGVVATLGGPDDILLIDSDSHASIYDAVKLSSAKILRFRHNDMKDLAHRLERLEGTPGNRIIVAEGIYSMLGDRAPLAEMIAIKKRFGAYLVLDEAHSVGVLGPSGRGLAEELGLLDDVDVLTGTFSKSLGTVGGFCVSSLPDFEVMRVVCRPYMFAASLPPAVIASTSAALRALQTTPALRLRLWRNIPVLYNGLRAAGFSVGPHEGPIVAVAAGKGRDLAVHTWRQLLEAGYYVNLALSPATPGGISLLRCSVSAAHSVEQLQGLVDALTQIAHGNGLLPAPMAAMAAG
jgi:8-amino-7-oxononanoate synthase